MRAVHACVVQWVVQWVVHAPVWEGGSELCGVLRWPRAMISVLSWRCVVATVSADCDSECGTAGNTARRVCQVLANGIQPDEEPLAECGPGCQEAIDIVYSTCDCQETWEASKAEMKALTVLLGCNGASSATPALFIGIAAVLNHFLN